MSSAPVMMRVSSALSLPPMPLSSLCMSTSACMADAATAPLLLVVAGVASHILCVVVAGWAGEKAPP
eukprot:26980-Chlamydomonas_euryale.AAC.1